MLQHNPSSDTKAGGRPLPSPSVHPFFRRPCRPDGSRSCLTTVVLAVAFWSPLAGEGGLATRMIFPQFATGAGFQAELLLRSRSDREIQGSIQLYQGAGRELQAQLNETLNSSFDFLLPPRGVLRYQTPPAGELRVGYAVVEAMGQSSEITGSVVYRFAGSEVSVDPSPEATGQAGFLQTETLDAPNAEGDLEIKMGIALVNPNQRSLDLHLRMVDEFGVPQFITDLTLVAGEHYARFLDDAELFGPDLAGFGLANPFQGSLEVTSAGGDFAMTLLRMRLPSGRLANLGAKPLESVFAFSNVTVIPIDTDEVLPGHTVLVRGERIERIGPNNEVQMPIEAVVIDGTGRYLIPGLSDMHVHLGFRAEGLLFLANGVTTIREMWGGPGHVRLRDFIDKGDVLGPRMLVAGPGFDGNPPIWPRTVLLEDPSQAESEVDQYQAAGYDYIKIYNNLDPAPFQAVIQAAKARGMRWIGHIPWQVGVNAVIESGQSSIEHLLQLSQSVTGGAWWGTYNPASGRQLAERFAPLAIWNDPTISTNVAISLTPQEKAAILNSAEIRYMPPQRIAEWQALQSNQFDPSLRSALIANMQSLLLALHQAGARLLVGTDAGFPFVIPGFSIHDELRTFVEAGLTPLEALRIASLSAAQFAGRSGEFGAIREQRVADLVLLEANPLENIANLRHRGGVMVRGRWLPEAELQRRLEEQALSFQAGTTHSALASPLAPSLKGRHHH